MSTVLNTAFAAPPTTLDIAPNIGFVIVDNKDNGAPTIVFPTLYKPVEITFTAPVNGSNTFLAPSTTFCKKSFLMYEPNLVAASFTVPAIFANEPNTAFPIGSIIKLNLSNTSYCKNVLKSAPIVFKLFPSGLNTFTVSIFLN